jgi:hypothetical protein
MKTIEIVVSPQGEIRLITRGFTGRSCQDASRQLEQALGLRVSEQLTPEYHQAPQQADQHLKADR